MAVEKIIVVEDELVVRENLENYLRDRHFDVVSTPTMAGARDLLMRDNFDVVFLDIHLPDGDGTELLKDIQSRSIKPLIIITTGFGTVKSAVECMKNGAFDYILKPYSHEHINFTLKKAEEFSHLLKVNRYLSSESNETALELLGNSPAMERVRQLIRKVARTQATVLIQGESGTGKELVARALYRESSRATGPFIKVNCAAVPENLIESEFFGHEKGAFTGALNKREGRFELAHNGTILLDEISEISPSVQAKLLRVLQEREFERVGGNRPIKVDVRVVATTNRHLEQSVEKKEFRQDLFFRLNVVPIHVPPLRERAEDIPQLATAFMRHQSRKHGINVKDFTLEAMQALKAHHWPGNVRELQNVIERAIILCDDHGMLDVEHLGLTSSESLCCPSPNMSGMMTLKQENGFLTLDELERNHIFAALQQSKGNRTHAAKMLNVSIRTLRNKLHEYNGTATRSANEDKESVVLGK